MTPSDDLAVNVVGYLEAENGLGEVARGLIASLSAAGVKWSASNWDRTAARQENEFSHAGAGDGHPITIACVNADRFIELLHHGGLADNGAYRIGVWAWETEVFPRFMARVAPTVDEIWTLSEHSARAIRAATSVSTYVFAPPILAAPPAALHRPAELPPGFVFLFSFDFLSIVERKNPRAVIDAFVAAFAPDEGPQLVLKSVNGDHQPDALNALRAAAAGRADVHFVDRYLPEPQQRALIRACDAYVSLHRAEGFGLTIAEAMAGGKPVIATGYSGNVDFMTDANSCLVPFRLREIPEGCFPYPPGTPWAEPDVVVAAALMRRVYADRAWAEALGARAAADMSNAFAPEARADFLNARLRAARTRPVRHRMPVLLRPTTQRLKTLVRPVRGAARRISRAAGSRSRSAS